MLALRADIKDSLPHHEILLETLSGWSQNCKSTAAYKISHRRIKALCCYREENTSYFNL